MKKKIALALVPLTEGGQGGKKKLRRCGVGWVGKIKQEIIKGGGG